MRNNDGNVGTGTGGISILAIFVVLCLTTLAALSLVSAQADYSLAERTINASAQYYKADARAQERLAEIVTQAQKDAEWEATLRNGGYEVTPSSGGVVVRFEEPISDIKYLFIEIKLALDAGGRPNGEWSILNWQSRIFDVQQEAETLPLFQ